MPSSLEEYFELMAMASEAAPCGFGLSISEFNEMMPWQLDSLLVFKAELKEKIAEMKKPQTMS